MLRRLTARGFRNLAPFDWSTGPGCHLLLGGTGAGKTSVLEAIYVLLTTKSFRTSNLAHCLARSEPSEVRDGPDLSAEESQWLDQQGTRGFFLSGDVEQAHLELGWQAGEGIWRRKNEKSTTLVEHLESQPVLSWTAADAELLGGPPELRRRLLDRGLVARRAQNLGLLSRYRQALRQKRELLVRQQGGLEAWNEVLAEHAAALIAERQSYAAEPPHGDQPRARRHGA